MSEVSKSNKREKWVTWVRCGSLGTSKLLARVRSEVREHERMRIGTIGRSELQIFTLDFVNGLALANRSFGLQQ